MDADRVRAFYDDLASDYHLIYGDWWGSVERQGKALCGLVAGRLGREACRILDCTCGIGTQSLGLALGGHQVLGTDLSEHAVARAAAEAGQRGLDSEFRAWDVRDIAALPGGPFDLVLSADNSLPHLTEQEDLQRAVRGMWALTAPGGAAVVSTRDYDLLLEDRPGSQGPYVMGAPGARRIVLQIWDWHESAPIYTLHHLTLEETREGWSTAARSCDYRAVRRTELEACFRQAGAVDMEWLEPEASGFFQPLLWVSRARQA